jgi:hypothetical protein
MPAPSCVRIPLRHVVIEEASGVVQHRADRQAPARAGAWAGLPSPRDNPVDGDEDTGLWLQVPKGDSVVSISTRLALTRRAKWVADRLEDWRTRLSGKVVEQNRRYWRGKDSMITLTLEPYEMDDLIRNMQEWSVELRRFAK